jgi:hypothetical protein
MLDNVITLAVDVLNDDDTVDYDFTRSQEYVNRTIYTGETHSLVAQDQLTFYRTFPKPSGNFRGTGKSAFKFSQDFSVTGADGLAALTSPVILEVSFSVPVGVAVADQLVARQRAIALLDMDSVMVALMNQLMV